MTIEEKKLLLKKQLLKEALRNERVKAAGQPKSSEFGPFLPPKVAQERDIEKTTAIKPEQREILTEGPVMPAAVAEQRGIQQDVLSERVESGDLERLQSPLGEAKMEVERAQGALESLGTPSRQEQLGQLGERIREGFNLGGARTEVARQEVLEAQRRGEIGPIRAGAERGLIAARRAVEPFVEAGMQAFVQPEINRKLQTAQTVGGAITPNVIEEPLKQAFAEALGTTIEGASQALDTIPPGARRSLANLYQGGEAIATLLGVGALAKGGRKIAKEGAEAVAETALGQKTRQYFVDLADQKALRRIENAAEEADKIVGRVAQIADKKKLPQAYRALNEIDLTDVQDYGDLVGRVQEKTAAYLGRVNEELLKYPEKLQLSDLVKTTTVGDTDVTQNFVADALDQLAKAYQDANDPVNLARVQQLRDRMNAGDLARIDINNIAKEHGAVRSAFTQTGNLSQSVSKQAYEQTRKGVKETVRELMPDQTIRELDGKVSDLITLKDDLSVVEKRLRNFQNRAAEQNLLQKVTGQAVDVINTVLGGTPVTIMQKLIPTLNSGKINYAELQDMLPKLLKQLDKLNATSDPKKIESTIKTINNLSTK